MTKPYDPALAFRWQILVSGLFKYASQALELEDGYAFKFRRSAFLARRMADYLLFEARHSPRLTFEIDVEPDGVAAWLQVRGPGNAKDQIRVLYLQHQSLLLQRINDQ